MPSQENIFRLNIENEVVPDGFRRGDYYVIGKTMLSDMLEGREEISKELQKIIDEHTEPWGINVISVEVKDVLIPSALKDAMSMEARRKENARPA